MERVQAASALVPRQQAWCIVGNASKSLLSHVDGRGSVDGDEGETGHARPVPDVDADAVASAQIVLLHKRLKVTRPEVTTQSRV